MGFKTLKTLGLVQIFPPRAADGFLYFHEFCKLSIAFCIAKPILQAYGSVAHAIPVGDRLDEIPGFWATLIRICNMNHPKRERETHFGLKPEKNH